MDTTMIMTIEQTMPKADAPLSLRPRTFAGSTQLAWDTNAYATTGVSFVGGVAGDAAVSTGMRDRITPQGPPRGIPR